MMKIGLVLLFIFTVQFGFGQVKRIGAKPTPSVRPISVPEQIPTQKVVITKLNGDRLTGLLVAADTRSLSLEISGTKLRVLFTEITEIRFGEGKLPDIVAPPTKVDTLKEASLSLEAAIIYNYGGVQVLARTTFYLLDESAEAILAKSEIKPNKIDKKYVTEYGFGLKFPTIPEFSGTAELGTQALRPHILKEFTTDLQGKTIVHGLKPGTYWLFGFTLTRGGFAMWNLERMLVEGENKCILDQNNAVVAH